MVNFGAEGRDVVCGRVVLFDVDGDVAVDVGGHLYVFYQRGMVQVAHQGSCPSESGIGQPRRCEAAAAWRPIFLWRESSQSFVWRIVAKPTRPE